ncbi:MAG: hypothetical protein ACLFP4_01945 [Spirochaetales bacterium]
MLTLSNGRLTVEVVDPKNDDHLLGTRYCAAGYIFQVADESSDSLLSGPTYPESYNTFDGQGIPDTFHRAPLRTNKEPDHVLIPGVGRCSADHKELLEPAAWSVSTERDRLSMSSDHEFEEFRLRVSRAVKLMNRTVRSVTRVDNLAKGFVPISWYPHPFFPHPNRDDLCRFSTPIGLLPNDGFTLEEDQWVSRVGWPWNAGYIAAVDHAARDHVMVSQRHPSLGNVTITFGYVPSYTMIYGNQHCFSIEPYLERTLGIGQSVEWFVDYTF